MKKNFKKVLSMVMILAMALMIVPMAVSAEDPAPVTLTGEGTEASPYLVGTAAEMTALKDATMAMAEGSVVYVKMTADIEVAADFQLNASVYAGDANAKIGWNFDGQGYTLKGMTQALFGGLNKQGGGHTFKNLVLDVAIADTERYTGGIAGILYGNATFENITVKGSITTDKTGGNVHAGGIVGVAERDGAVLSFINCKNYADITMPKAGADTKPVVAGGIIGSIKHYSTTGDFAHTVLNCENYGDIIVNDATYGYAGGLVGMVNPNANVAGLNYTFTVENGINEGVIGAASTEPAYAAAAKAGAIVGEFTQQGAPIAEATQTYVAKFNYNMNEQDGLAVYNKIDEVTVTVEGPATPFMVGTYDELVALKAESIAKASEADDAPMKYPVGARFAVKLTADIELADGSFRFNNSVYAGDHNAKLMWYFDGQGNTISGGAQRLFSGLNCDGIVFKNLHFNVAIQCAERYVGALACLVSKSITLDGLTVSGTVTCTHVPGGAQCVGALIGNISQHGNVTIKNCANYATITGAEATDAQNNVHVGGLVGSWGTYGSSAALTQVLENCVNEGVVMGGANAGGLVGRFAPEGTADHFPMYDITVKNCVNKGAVVAQYATANIGAIVGYFTGANGTANKAATVVDCYNTNADIAELVNINAEELATTVTNCFKAAEAADAANADAIAAIDANIHAHTYTADCTADCLTCGYERKEVAPHAGETCESAACAACGAELVPGTCSWANACDAECDVCGATREVPAHEYTYACDDKCAVCGAGDREAAPHTYTNCEDADCDVCGDERTAPGHAWDNDQDTTCNNCDTTRTVETPNAGNTNTDKTDDKTDDKADNKTDDKADTTTKPADEKKGCKSALNSTYAVVALVAVLGFAFVAKKREEN